MRVHKSLLILAAAFLIGSCSGDDGGTEEDASPTSAAETTTTEATTTTTGPPPAPPAAGEPGTVTLVFADGETATAEVSCQLDPVGEFATVAESSADSTPFFGLTLWTDPDRLPEANWQTEDENWLAGGPAGTELEVSVEATTITGTAVFKTTSGQKSASAFAIACPE